MHSKTKPTLIQLQLCYPKVVSLSKFPIYKKKEGVQELYPLAVFKDQIHRKRLRALLLALVWMKTRGLCDFSKNFKKGSWKRGQTSSVNPTLGSTVAKRTSKEGKGRKKCSLSAQMGTTASRAASEPTAPRWNTAFNSTSKHGLPRFGWDTAMGLWGTGVEVAAGWRLIWFKGWFITFLGSCHVVIFSMWLKEGKQLSFQFSVSLSLSPSPITAQQSMTLALLPLGPAAEQQLTHCTWFHPRSGHLSSIQTGLHWGFCSDSVNTSPSLSCSRCPS